MHPLIFVYIFFLYNTTTRKSKKKEKKKGKEKGCADQVNCYFLSFFFSLLFCYIPLLSCIDTQLTCVWRYKDFLFFFYFKKRREKKKV